MNNGNFENGFNTEAFVEWIEDILSLNTYAVEMVYNIIKYAQAYKNVSKDQMAYFISDLLPDEISFLDVAKYCGDNELSTHTLVDLGRK